LDSLASLVSPTIRSLISSSLPSEVQGRLFSSLALIECIVGVVSPSIFGSIYAETVGWKPQFLFWSFGGVFFIAFLISFGLKEQRSSQSILIVDNKADV